MRLKTAFCFLCSTVLIAFCFGLSNSYSDDCTSYLKDYLNKFSDFESARDLLLRSKVATAILSPMGSVPPEWKHLEQEYKTSPDAFVNKLIEGLSIKLPSGFTSWAQVVIQVKAVSAEIAAVNAYDVALVAYSTGKKNLEKCQGMSILTIWCERGADCKTPPGVRAIREHITTPNAPILSEWGRSSLASLSRAQGHGGVVKAWVNALRGGSILTLR